MTCKWLRTMVILSLLRIGLDWTPSKWLKWLTYMGVIRTPLTSPGMILQVPNVKIGVFDFVPEKISTCTIEIFIGMSHL